MKYIIKFCLLLFLVFVLAFQITAQSSSTSSTTLSMLTYNVWALPIWYPRIDKKYRYRQLPNAIHQKDYDIVCLQEVFDKKLRKRLLPVFDQHYHYNDNSDCKKNKWKDCHGGLMTFSKYPIVSEYFYEYRFQKGMNAIEKLGKKGFLISEIQTDNGIIYIINTHLYAGYSNEADLVRQGQLEQVHQYLKINQLYDKTIFFLGDFNMTHPQLATSNANLPASGAYKLVTKTMNFEDTVQELNEGDYTYSNIGNTKYNPHTRWPRKLDYCFYQTSNTNQVTLKNKSVVFNQNNILSDHFGFYSLFDIQLLNQE